MNKGYQTFIAIMEKSSISNLSREWRQDECFVPPPLQSSIIALWTRGCLIKNLWDRTNKCKYEGRNRSPGSRGALHPGVLHVGGHLHLSRRPLCTLCFYSSWGAFGLFICEKKCNFPLSSNYLNEKHTMPEDRVKGRTVEKRESSYTVGGNVNWYIHYGEQYGGSLKS